MAEDKVGETKKVAKSSIFQSARSWGGNEGLSVACTTILTTLQSLLFHQLSLRLSLLPSTYSLRNSCRSYSHRF